MATTNFIKSSIQIVSNNSRNIDADAVAVAVADTDNENNTRLSFEENFGILSIKTPKIEITKTPIAFLFSIDNSGSMDEMDINDKGTKLDFVKQTFKNMLTFFSKQAAEIYICVNTFSEEVVTIIDFVRVSNDNVSSLIDKIYAITTDSSTNIEGALEQASKQLTQYNNEFLEHQIAHIFMSDGEPTTKETRSYILSELVNSLYPNIMIGFGTGHNVKLMRRLSNNETGEYLFIDNMETTSLIYGEIIHKFLYPCVRFCNIVVENGDIYDWKTNKWVRRIEEPVIVGDAEKTYHIKSTHPTEKMNIEIHGIRCDDLAASNQIELLDISTIQDRPDILTIQKYAHRQVVLELMYDCLNIDRCDRELHREMKHRLRLFFSKMQRFIHDNHLQEDSFMKMLCDDISIVYKTVGTREGHMYTSSRQNSQGRQTTVCNTPSNRISLSLPTQNVFDNRQDDDVFNLSPIPLRRSIRRSILFNNRSVVHNTDSAETQIPDYDFPTEGIAPHITSMENDESTQPIEPNIISIASRGSFSRFPTDLMDMQEEPDYDIENYGISDRNISHYATDSTMETLTQMTQPL